jgi:hypothetical protein
MKPAVRIIASLAVIAIAVIAIAVWIIRGPGPMAFVDGPKVALSDYRGGNPTGVPALAKASRGARRILARAADRRLPPAARRERPAASASSAVRHALFDQHYPGQGNRDRQLQ